MTGEYPRLTRTGSKPVTGIVHLGPGAFARAFLAPVVAEAMAASGGDWGILGISLRSAGTMRDLAPQDWAYSAVEMGADGEEVRRIEALTDILVAADDPGAAVAAMADPAVRIVSLTITEKGYCHLPSSGTLDPENADIRHDIDRPLPRTAPGFIVRALAARRAAGSAPFTVLSCDNLPENGALTRRVILALATRIDPGLADWIAENARFPATMVDRITPATTPADIDRIATRTGVHDAAPVLHEAFRQFVIEDDFVRSGPVRPDFAAAGVQMVDDVAPFEHMKLRMLNGAHSALAYLGFLAGHETIADTVADPDFAEFVGQLWAEIMPTLIAPPGTSLPGYADALLLRFANRGIRHKTAQIAMDGSQKLPQRLVSTLVAATRQGGETRCLALAVAGWMRYVSGIDEAGRDIDVVDPMAARLRAIARRAEGADGIVQGLFGVTDIFPADCVAQISGPVTDAARALWEPGAQHAVRCRGARDVDRRRGNGPGRPHPPGPTSFRA